LHNYTYIIVPPYMVMVYSNYIIVPPYMVMVYSNYTLCLTVLFVLTYCNSTNILL